MLKPNPSEKELIGSWVIFDGRVIKDAVCERIEWLTSSYLKKIATSKKWGEWETLYEDPEDGRFWERTYPQSEMHGGGPSRLVVLDSEQARVKYEIA